MKHILFFKQSLLIFLFMIIFSCYFSLNISNEFFECYLSYLSNAPIRYCLIIITIIFNCLVYKRIYTTLNFTRYKNKFKLLYNSIIYELLLNLIFFIFFNLIVIIFNLPISLNYIVDILLIIFNYLIISLTVSLIINFLNLFVNKRFFAGAIFLFIFVCVDICLNHFSFFYFGESSFNFNYLYILNYMSSNGLFAFIVLFIFNIIIFNIIILLYSKSDFMIEKK